MSKLSETIKAILNESAELELEQIEESAEQDETPVIEDEDMEEDATAPVTVAPTPDDLGPGVTAGSIAPGTNFVQQIGQAQMPIQPVIAMNTYMKEEVEKLLEGKMTVALDREAFGALFEGEEAQLSADFKTKAADLFEAACNEKLNSTVKVILETVDAFVSSEVATKLAEESAKIDAVADATASEWLQENQIAIESGIRAEMAESFISKLHTLFEEHYVDVPKNRVDLLEAMQQRVDKLEESVSAEMEKTIAATKQLNEAQRELAFVTATKGMTEVQIDKVRTLSEGVAFTSEQEFSDKIKALAEAAGEPKAAAKVIMEDAGKVVKSVTDEPAVQQDDSVMRYVQHARANR